MNAYSQQDGRPDIYESKINSSRINILDAAPSKISNNKFERKFDERFEYMKSLQLNLYKPPVEIKGNFRFDLIGSVNSNVKFGGFYNGSVNIQFSPAMYIKPFDFLSIYANHQKNLFIPMQSLRENMVSLAVETTGMVIIENAIKIFAPPNKVVRGLTEFTLKNCISYLVYSLFNVSNQASQNDNSGVYKYDFYYISAGITF